MLKFSTFVMIMTISSVFSNTSIRAAYFLLPDRRPKLDYKLEPQCHDRELAHKLGCLTENNFHFITPFIH